MKIIGEGKNIEIKIRDRFNVAFYKGTSKFKMTSIIEKAIGSRRFVSSLLGARTPIIEFLKYKNISVAPLSIILTDDSTFRYLLDTDDYYFFISNYKEQDNKIVVDNTVIVHKDFDDTTLQFMFTIGFTEDYGRLIATFFDKNEINDGVINYPSDVISSIYGFCHYSVFLHALELKETFPIDVNIVDYVGNIAHTLNPQTAFYEMIAHPPKDENPEEYIERISSFKPFRI